MRTRLLTALCAVLLAQASLVHAQWIHLPLPGTPRAANGAPDLAAPPPKAPDGHVDLSGIWRTTGEVAISFEGQDLPNLARVAEIPMRPEAERQYREAQATRLKDMSSLQCFPHGVPGSMLVRNLPFKIVQAPGVVLMLFEEFVDYRQIFTDGRALPTDPNPTWYGYSVGEWQPDSLVVRSLGFNDRTWLDLAGHGHSEALRTTEVFRRPRFGHMDVEVTFDDPKTFTRPWSATLPFELVPDTELLEYVCENERDARHSIGH